ncbi:universal stress protein [Salinirubellus sp. GCM10025818]|uniref:universal stress protein n=1 Tax=Salinirubellus TaxID=2162630 RepID=UPI0030CE0680
MYDTVLIPSDGSEHAVRAAEHGVYLARAFDATVHLLNVVDVQAAAGPFNAGGVDKAFVERLESEGRTAIEAVEAVADEEDRVETTLVRGSPAEAILEYGSENGVDLIAMGTHGRTGLERYVAGSVTERVLRLAEVPVLTARATGGSRLEGEYTDVLVPTDGSDHAARAAGHGIAVAERVGARVHAVTAVDVERLDSVRDFASITGLRERLGEDGERWTAAVAARAEEAGLDAVTDVREGSPAKTLLAYADEHDVDLIAMGTRGRTGLDRYLLGSTTERTIRRSDVPVLAVNERE